MSGFFPVRMHSMKWSHLSTSVGLAWGSRKHFLSLGRVVVGRIVDHALPSGRSAGHG